ALRGGQVADDVDQNLVGSLEAERGRVAYVELDDPPAFLLEAFGLFENRTADVVKDVFELAGLTQLHHVRNDRTNRLDRAMEFTEVVRRRRMVRAYDPSRPVPRAVIDDLLELATHAPSAGFSQGWQFLVLDTPAGCDAFWKASVDPGELPDSWL